MVEAKTSRIMGQGVTDLVCVVAFCAILFLPLAGFLFDWHPVTPPVAPHHRAGKPLPPLRPANTFPERFERYFDKHLGFRQQMVRWNNAIVVLVLRSHPTTRVRLGDGPGVASGRVFLGKDGWLYFLASFSEDSFRGLDPLSEGEVRAWATYFERRQLDLAHRGVRYTLVVVPETPRAVPEHLPTILERRVGPSRSDQIVRALLEQTQIEVLDLRDWMKEQRTEYPIYHRTGTHWNELGAYLAYRAILLRLKDAFPSLEAWSLSDFEVRYRVGEDRGISWMLGTPRLMTDEYVDLIPLRPRLAEESGRGRPDKWMQRFVQRGLWPGGWVQTRTGRRDLPRAVLLHDSFVATYMEPFLSEHFEEATYYWAESMPVDRLMVHEPDIVIEIRTERIFDTHVPTSKGALRRRPATN